MATPPAMTAVHTPQSAPVSDTLHVTSVKLRILSEALETVQEFEGKLQLTCAGDEQSCCRLSFNNGKSTAWCETSV